MVVMICRSILHSTAIDIDIALDLEIDSRCIGSIASRYR